MKISGSLVALCVGASLIAAPAQTETWVKAESEYFTIYSDSSAAVTKTFVTNLEAYYYTLYQLYRMKNAGADLERPRFTTYLLNDRRDMRAVWPGVDERIAGFYTECEDGALAYATFTVTDAGGATHLRRQDGGYDYSTLFHEYAHHFMFENYAVALPAWYVEGFAEYFSSMQIKGRDLVIGQAQSDRYSDLFSNTWLDFGDMLRGKRPSDSKASLQFYAQSWLLTHYIMASPERLRIFALYIDDINGGADPVTSFESRFGVKVQDLSGVLHTYLQKGVPAVSFTFNTMPEAVVTLTPMPKAADKLLLWQSVLQTCRANVLGDGFLASIKTETAKYPDDPWAQMVDARAELLLGDAARAETLLNARVSADPQNHEVQYLLGRLYYKKAQGNTSADKTSDWIRARSALLKAYKLDPMYAPGLYYLSLAQANLPAYPNDASINAAVQASNLAPSVSEYAWYAAQLLIIKDRAADAATLLTPLAANPHSPQTAAKARAAIDAIKAGKTKDEVLALLGASNTKDED